MRKVYFLCISLILFKVVVFGQISISGKITEKNSGKAISGVNVYFPKLNLGAVSDTNGYYEINNLPKGKQNINLKLLGYVPLSESINLNENLVRNFSLEQKNIELSQIEISGNRNNEAQLGPLGNISIKDIPFSINVTSYKIIENRSSHTMADALQTNPTVAALMVPNSYSSMNRVMIRGFTAADQSEMRDGLTDRSFTLSPVEIVERIEVQNGLSGFFYGFSAIGGTINYISKQAVSKPLASLSLGQYGGGINYIHADIGGPIDSAKKLTFRFNSYIENGKTYISGSKQKRMLFAGVLNYRIFPKTNLKIDFYNQNYDLKGLQTYFLPYSEASIPIIPKAFDATKQFGQSWTYNESQKLLIGASIESKITKVFSFRAAYRYGDMWRKYSYVGATLLDKNGNYSEKYFDSPRQYETTHSAYAFIDANFYTWKIRHEVTIGYSGTSYLFKRGADVNAVLGNSNIDKPIVYDTIPKYATNLTTSGYQALNNIIISERITFNKYLSLLLGGNFATVHQVNKGVSIGIPWFTSSEYSQLKITPSIAITFKPISAVSTYISFMQGLVPGGTAPSTYNSVPVKNATEVLNPSVCSQYELGVKASFWNIDITTNIFHINKINEYVDPKDTTYKQDGREVHQGVEAIVSGKLFKCLTLGGGFTYMQATIKRAANNTATEGKIPVNIPQIQARGYLEYAIPKIFFISGLSVSAGVNYYGKRPVNILNTAFLPGATTFDAALRYEPIVLKRKLTFNINVSNLINTSYWSYYRDGDGLILGTPRIISFSAKIEL